MRLRDVVSRWLGGAPVEERAIDSVPWDVGGPSRPSLVSADQALGLVPVFAAVRLLASQVASLPLQAYRKTGDTRQRIPAPSLFVSPSVQGTTYDWLHRCVTSLALRGNAFGLITQRDRDQYPTMVEWLHPDDVFVDDRQASGPGSFANPIWYWQGRIVPAEDLIHIPWFTVPGRVLGLSPIGACAATISTGLSAQNYTSDWFDNGAVPPGEFRNTAKTVNQVEADIISTRLNAAIRRRKPLVYGNDWEYKPISVSAHEAKFLETTKMTATQVAAMYGIPPEMIGGEAGGPLTYNTVEQNSLNFLKFTLRPWLECLEAAFYRLTPRPQYVKFNIDALLRSDLTTRMQAYQLARNIGLQNIDEQRALEDLSPIPGGRGQDYTPLEVLTKQAATPSQPALRVQPEVVDAEEVDGQPTLGAAAFAALQARKFDPHQLRDPHTGEWIDVPGDAVAKAAKALGRISEDDFYAAHGEDFYDQYGPASELGAILWKDGTASLYRDLGKGRVQAFGDVDSKSARRLSGDLRWAVGQPDSGPPGGGKLAGRRQADLGHLTAEVGYGYDGSGDLFVRVTMPPVGREKRPTVIDLQDLDQAESLAGDLDLLADDMDSGAYTGDTPGLSRGAAVTPGVRVRVISRPTLGAAALVALRTRQHDPSHPAALSGDVRKYNPLQPRDPGGEGGGQWTKSPTGAAKALGKDLLELAGRIDLDPREKLISSGRLDGENGSDTDLSWAVVHSPAGNEVRIGIIPTEDSDKWRAADLGGTAILDAGQVRKLRGDLTKAQAEAKRADKEAGAMYAGAGLPANPTPRQQILSGAAPVAEGVMPTDWADLHWDIHLTGDEDPAWQLTFWPADPADFTGNGATFEPKTVTKLLRTLDDIEAELADPAARGRAPRRRSRRGAPAHPVGPG